MNKFNLKGGGGTRSFFLQNPAPYRQRGGSKDHFSSSECLGEELD